MDMVTFGKHFIDLELPSCALSCFLLIPQSEIKEKHVNGLLSSNCHITILNQLSDLKSQARTVPLADQVRTQTSKYFYSECGFASEPKYITLYPACSEFGYKVQISFETNSVARCTILK